MDKRILTIAISAFTIFLSAAAQTPAASGNGEWIKRGRSGIIVSRDSLGVVRAMAPFSGPVTMGRAYADAVSEYARQLQPDGVQVYSILVPSQGEYYMPESVGGRGNQQRVIEATAEMLDPLVKPVLIDSVFKKHLDEELYNRTDHHWGPLGAYYASGELARVAGVKFRPLSEYTTDTIPNYVGTMRRFSGVAELSRYPEEFVYYLPPEGYEAEFTVYKVVNNRTVSEGKPHVEKFFKHYADPGSAYITFMGGDYRTGKITNTGGTPGRKLLIVKDSYGNAMVPCLFGSFEEVHVVDFRYFPHNLAEYARDNDITDMVFVNVLSIGLSKNASTRFLKMLEQ